MFVYYYYYYYFAHLSIHLNLSDYGYLAVVVDVVVAGDAAVAGDVAVAVVAFFGTIFKECNVLHKIMIKK